MTDQEKAIATRLVDALLKRELPVTVYCEGEEDVSASSDRAEILEYATASECVEIVAPDLWFMLVYGNDPDGSELIADYTDSALAEEIVKETGHDPT